MSQKPRKPVAGKTYEVEAHIYMERELLEAIKREAENADRSVTAEIRRTLREAYLA